MYIRAALVVSTVAVLVFATVCPVAAFYFEFSYFETDKTVYEVGETINMAACLTADFSETGWCYVSFSVVTDMGPVYDDTHFLGASPSSQLVSSAYTIDSTHTSPGPLGVNAFVSFNVEIYDKYSQAGGDTIGVNITRGHLMTSAVSSLEVECRSNASLVFEVVSIHTDAVALRNGTLDIQLQDANHQLLYQSSATTNQTGAVAFSLPSENWAQGTYNLSFSFTGSDDFLPFCSSWPFTVTAMQSNLSLVSLEDTIYCQTPDGQQWEDLDITVLHSDRDYVGIDDSTLVWTTCFSSGTMVGLGQGFYQGCIPFTIEPGTYELSITTTNPAYKSVESDFAITVLPRPLNILVTMNDCVSGLPLLCSIVLLDALTNDTVPLIQLTGCLSIDGKPAGTFTGYSSMDGTFEYIIEIPSEMWGTAQLDIEVRPQSHYSQFNESLLFEVSYQPTIHPVPLTAQVIGEKCSLHVTVYNPLNATIGGLLARLNSLDNISLATGFTSSDGTILFEWTVQWASGPGMREYMIITESDSSRFVKRSTYQWACVAYAPLELVQPESTSALRGTTVSVSFVLTSVFNTTESLNITFFDDDSQIIFSSTVIPNVVKAVEISLDSNLTLGIHTLIAMVNSDAPFVLIGNSRFELTVIGTLNFTVIARSAFYGESLEVTIDAWDDADDTPATISLGLVSNNGLLALLPNIDFNASLSVPLPLSLEPGRHLLTVTIDSPWLISANQTTTVTIWMRTRIVVEISPVGTVPTVVAESRPLYLPDTASSISCGSIMKPPPILFNGTTSTTPAAARDTSPTSCPRLISGTSNLSTVSANERTSLSGNGQIVFSRIDRNRSGPELIIASSTDLDVQPKEITPHFASEGP